jgi:hypothetical protein
MTTPQQNKVLLLSTLFYTTDSASGLIGDLVNMPTSNLTSAGQLLRFWLLHVGSAIDNNKLSQPECATDVCCPWYTIADDLTELFVDPATKECTDDARAAVRLGFHDAASWSKKLSAGGKDTGGADGSFILFREDERPENNGLQGFVTKILAVRAKHPGVSAADLIQFAAHHATVSCPQGPRIAFFAGRIDATEASPPGLVPDVHDSSQNLIDLFMDKTINAADLAALLGAHTSAKQFHVDEGQAGKPIDSTPGIWDTNFYNETLQSKTNATDGVFRFPSDLLLSKAEHVAVAWEGFVGEQGKWNEVSSLRMGMTSRYILTLLGVCPCLYSSWVVRCEQDKRFN